MPGRWNKRSQHNGPDIWEYINNHIGDYPAIALLKSDDKVIAEFWGPRNLPDKKIIKSIQSEYQAEVELRLCRLGSSNRTITIKHSLSHS